MISGTMENLITSIISMNRSQLITLLQTMHCSFPLDFSAEFMNTLSTDRLRHIAMTASLHEVKACA